MFLFFALVTFMLTKIKRIELKRAKWGEYYYILNRGRILRENIIFIICSFTFPLYVFLVIVPYIYYLHLIGCPKKRHTFLCSIKKFSNKKNNFWELFMGQRHVFWDTLYLDTVEAILREAKWWAKRTARLSLIDTFYV